MSIKRKADQEDIDKKLKEDNNARVKALKTREFFRFMNSEFHYNLCVEIWPEKEYFVGIWDLDNEDVIKSHKYHHFYSKYLNSSGFEQFFNRLSIDSKKRIIERYKILQKEEKERKRRKIEEDK